MNTRKKYIEIISDLITDIQQSHPVRVGIDGVDASGKTMLAKELANVIRQRNRHCIRVSIDSFHNPKEIRYRQGRNASKGYFEDSFDYETFINEVLKPLGPKGNFRYKTACFDYVTNSKVNETRRIAPINSILLVDGIFLHRPELISYWDFSIFIEASFEIILKRALTRKQDQRYLKSNDMIKQMYLSRYIPAQTFYLNRFHPDKKANAVLINNDFHNPELIINGLI